MPFLLYKGILKYSMLKKMQANKFELAVAALRSVDESPKMCCKIPKAKSRFAISPSTRDQS